MMTQPYFSSLLFTTQLKMKQIYTLLCSFTLFILDSWMYNVINSSKMNSLKTIQEFSKTRKYSRPRNCFSRIKDITSFDSKFKDSPWCSRTSSNLSYEQHTVCMRNWPFCSNCIMPRDRIFDWGRNSSSHVVAASMLGGKLNTAST